VKFLTPFLLTLFTIGFAGESQAQKPDRYVTVSTDTTTDVDTSIITYTMVPNGIKSFQSTVTRVSGTAAGKVYFEGTTDGNAWVRLDSLVLTNQVTNSKFFNISTQPTCYSYRAYYISSGTQTSYQRFSYLRRPD